MKVLELGSYVVPAYAGMILSEQGVEVTKWTLPPDPIQECHLGDELWAWINHGKQVDQVDLRSVELSDHLLGFNAVIENFRPAFWDKLGYDRKDLAERHGIAWVSMQSEDNDRSFDLIAQARTTMSFCGHIPFWIGDTSGGLWVAFKLLSMLNQGVTGHAILGQSSCLQKLVEGELIVTADRTGPTIPWEVDTYRVVDGEAVVGYRGTEVREPVRDHQWRLENLWHDNGRMRI